MMNVFSRFSRIFCGGVLAFTISSLSFGEADDGQNTTADNGALKKYPFLEHRYLPHQNR